MTNTTTSPSGSRSPATPATPASSVSSVRAIVSWLETSGGSKKETNRTIGSVPGKITTGRVAAAHIHALSPTNRLQDVQRPAVIVANAPPIKPAEQTTSPTLKRTRDKVQEKDQQETTEKVLEKAPVKALGEVFEKIAVKTPTNAVPAPPLMLLSSSIPFSPTRTLFPRNASPVRCTSASTASLAALNNNGPPSTPTTPSWRRRHFAGDHCDRSALGCASSSLPAMPTTTVTPETPATPIRAAAKYSETPEDYSLTLLRYKAYFERPLARCLDEEGEMVNEDTHKGGRVNGKVSANVAAMDEQEPYGSTPRRQEKDVDAFWAPVRQYLLITDEELYES